MKYCYLDDKAIVEFSGEDSGKFLQAMITNDISLLDAQNVIYTLFLNAQGRFLFDAFISKHGFSYLLEVSKVTLDKFIARMNMFKLNSKFEINVKEDLKVAYFDSKIAECLYSYKDPRYAQLKYRTISPQINKSYILDEDLYLKDKYQYTIIDGNTELIYEKSLVPEYRMENLSAISFSKGCYTGQEVISRAKYQGQLRKSIYLIKSADGYINPDETEIRQNGDIIGKICSIWRNYAIGLIRDELLNGNYVEIGNINASVQSNRIFE